MVNGMGAVFEVQLGFFFIAFMEGFLLFSCIFCFLFGLRLFFDSVL